MEETISPRKQYRKLKLISLAVAAASIVFAYLKVKDNSLSSKIEENILLSYELQVGKGNLLIEVADVLSFAPAKVNEAMGAQLFQYDTIPGITLAASFAGKIKAGCDSVGAYANDYGFTIPLGQVAGILDRNQARIDSLHALLEGMSLSFHIEAVFLAAEMQRKNGMGIFGAEIDPNISSLSSNPELMDASTALLLELSSQRDSLMRIQSSRNRWIPSFFRGQDGKRLPPINQPNRQETAPQRSPSKQAPNLYQVNCLPSKMPGQNMPRGKLPGQARIANARA